MMHKLFLLFIIFTFSSAAYSQSTQNKVFVVVVDQKTSLPINDVYISDLKNLKYVYTDVNGKANISFLNSNDTLIFRRSNYTIHKVPYKELAKINFVVRLQSKNINISGITIFANKWEQNTTEFPYTTRSLSKDQLKIKQALTSADLMGEMGEVFLQKSQNGGGSPMIRGFAANGVLIVVDNVRMNNAIFRSGNLQNIINIQPITIEKAEVIYGPGSVTYGSDAMGGVMDFHLKKGEFSTSKKIKTDVNYTGMVASSPATMNHNLDVNFGLRKVAFRTVISYYEFSSLIAGKNHFGDYPEFGKRKWVQGVNQNGIDTVYNNPKDNKLTPSNYSSFGLLQNIRYQINKDILLTYSFVYSTTSDIHRYDKLISESKGNPKYADWYYGPQKWMMNNLNINYKKKNKYFDEGELVISHQQFEESRHDRKFGDDWLRNRTEKVNAIGLNADFNKDISDILKRDISVFYGLELMYNDVSSTGLKENIKTGESKLTSTRYPDNYNHYFTSGIYVNSKYRFNKDITFLAGLRLSLVNLSSGFTNTFNALPMNDIKLLNIAPNGSVGMAWVVTDRLLLNFNLSSAFRAPNIDDVSKIFDSEPGSVVVPNADLKPEYSYSSEASAQYRPFRTVSLRASIFYTYVDNVMVRRDFIFQGNDSLIYDGEMSKVQAITNAAYAHIYGSNMTIKIDLPWDFTLKSELTLMAGHDNEGNNLRHVPPTFGQTSLSYKYKDLWVDLFSNYSGKISFADLAPEERGKTDIYSPAGAESWYTINIRGGIKFKSGVAIILGFNNILDRFYIPYSSGIASPGRNVNLTLHVHL